MLSRGSYAAVNVERALVVVPGQGKTLKEPKTATSTRICYVAEPFAARLLELADGDAPILPAHPGKSIEGIEAYTSPRTATRNYKAWCARSGMEYIAPKNLRSSFATIHAEAGSLDSVVSLALGHSDGSTRGTYYQQRTRDELLNIADNMAGYLASMDAGRPRVTPSDPETAENGRKTAKSDPEATPCALGQTKTGQKENTL